MIKSRSFILDQITPIKIFAKLQKMFGREISLLFESGEKGEFSFMLIGAKEELKYYNGKTIFISEDGMSSKLNENPFQSLKK